MCCKNDQRARCLSQEVVHTFNQHVFEGKYFAFGIKLIFALITLKVRLKAAGLWNMICIAAVILCRVKVGFSRWGKHKTGRGIVAWGKELHQKSHIIICFVSLSRFLFVYKL